MRIEYMVYFIVFMIIILMVKILEGKLILSVCIWKGNVII